MSTKLEVKAVALSREEGGFAGAAVVGEQGDFVVLWNCDHTHGHRLSADVCAARYVTRESFEVQPLVWDGDNA